MNIIALCGPAGSGKDTVAGLLKVKDYRPATLAGPIRNMLVAGGFCTMEQALNPKLKETPLPGLGRSPRYLMQTLGTEWGRNIVGADVWLQMNWNLMQQGGDDSRWVITDVRFDNEAQFFRDRGARIWHIRNRRAQNVAAHTSEAGVLFQPGDEILDNGGPLDGLPDLVYSMNP